MFMIIEDKKLNKTVTKRSKSISTQMEYAPVNSSTIRHVPVIVASCACNFHSFEFCMTQVKYNMIAHAPTHPFRYL